jgi:CHAT domain-containing protein/Tfp pilus assembly protein PilF
MRSERSRQRGPRNGPRVQLSIFILKRALLLLICPAVLLPQTAREIPVLQPGDAVMQEYRAAWTLYQQGRLSEAITSLKALIARQKNYYRAYGTLIEAFERQQKLDEAEQYFHQLVSNEPANGMAEWALAGLAERTAKHAEAAAHATRCVTVAQELWPCYTMLGEAAWLSRRQWSDVEARTSELRGIRIPPLYLQAFLTAARVAAQAKSETRVEATRGLELAREAGDDDLEYYFLEILSGTRPAASGTRTGIDTWVNALQVAARLGDAQSYFDTANLLAESSADAGSLDAAYQYWNAIIPRLRELALEESLARALAAQGRVEALHRDLAVGVRNMIDAREHYRQAGALRSIAGASINIGDVLLDRGQYREAIHWYKEARNDNHTPYSPTLDGFALRGIGNAYGRIGEYLQALDYQHQSIREFEKDQRYDCVGASWGNIGALYVEMGSVREAIPSFRRALDAATRYEDGDLQEENLVNLGDAYLRLGQPTQAVVYLRQALQLAKGTTYPLVTSAGLRSMGVAENRLGHTALEIEWYCRALDLAKSSKLPVQEAEALELMGRSYARLNRNAEAKENFQQAIETADAVGSPEPALAARRGLASLARAEHKWHAAYDLLHSAIDRLEQMRATVPTPELRTSYLRDRAGVYEDMLDVLERLDGAEPSAGWAKAAFAYAERSRARAFVEMVAESRGQSQESGVVPIDATGAQGQAGDTAMLEFALGNHASLLWVITGKQFRMLRLPARAEIEKEVRAFRQQISTPPAPGADPAQWRTPARHLWTTLVGGAENEIARWTKWVIIPDGVLHYLPFETLISPAERCVMEDHTVVYAPSVSALNTLGQIPYTDPLRKELLAYGDPDFGTASGSLPALVRSVYRSAGMRLDPLPNTRREVRAIGALFPSASQKILVGRNATESSVKQEDLTQYRRLHFATHAFLDERSPSRSGVVLALHDPGGEDGVLRMNEILKLKLNADLVVLSACRTGLGTVVRGEGLVGLTRAFLYAGASRVVVSLWEVADAATADLMQSFYAAMRQSTSPAEALRSAKAKMLASDATVYRHPYYWAPFVVVGAQ